MFNLVHTSLFVYRTLQSCDKLNVAQVFLSVSMHLTFINIIRGSYRSGTQISFYLFSSRSAGKN
jgi:hypothetical protein